MRSVTTIFFVVITIVGPLPQGMADDAVPQNSVATKAPDDRSAGPQIVIKLQISEDRDGKPEVLSRPQFRTLNGQSATIQIDGVRAEIMAVVEPEVFSSPAESSDLAPRHPHAGSPAGEAIPINIRLSVGETQNGVTRPRIQSQLRVWNGEPASIKVGGFEVQLTALAVVEESPNISEVGISREELRLLCVLQKRISIDFNEATLRDVIKELAKRAEVNVVIDPRALDDEGLTAQSKITESARGLRLSTVLDLILGPLRLDYVVADEVIKITSRTRARGEPVTVTYPVSDLIARIEHGQLVADSDAEQNLVEQIAETLSPETWDRKGGRGSVRVFQPSHSLVVRQVADVHAEIAELLSQLRTARKRAAVTRGTEESPAKGEEPADRPLPASESSLPD